MNVLNKFTAVLLNSGSYPVFLNSQENALPQPSVPYIVVVTEGIFMDQSSLTIDGRVTRERMIIRCEFWGGHPNECWQMARETRNHLFNSGIRVIPENRDIYTVDDMQEDTWVLPQVFTALVANSDGFPDEDLGVLTGSSNPYEGQLMAFGNYPDTFITPSTEVVVNSGSSVHISHDLVVSGNIVGNISVTASADWNALTNVPSGIVSSSVQTIAHLSGSGIFSSSAQVTFNTSSADTASYVAVAQSSLTSISASYAVTASHVLGLPATSSWALNAVNALTASSLNFAPSIDWANNASASLTSVSASHAVIADGALFASQSVSSTSASYATHASTATTLTGGLDIAWATNASSSLFASSSVTSSHSIFAEGTPFASASLTAISASHAVIADTASFVALAQSSISASYSLTSSFALNGGGSVAGTNIHDVWAYGSVF